MRTEVRDRLDDLLAEHIDGDWTADDVDDFRRAAFPLAVFDAMAEDDPIWQVARRRYCMRMLHLARTHTAVINPSVQMLAAIQSLDTLPPRGLR